MKKYNVMHKLLAYLIVAILVTTISCESDDDGDTTPDQTMMEIVNDESNDADGLDSLAKYLNNYPDLVATLNADGEATLFAPTNQAFITLLQVTGGSINISDLDPEIVKVVLSYHLVPDETYVSSALTAGVELSTAYTDTSSSVNQVIVVNDDGSLLTGAPNSQVEIIEADLLATNGVVHKVEDVLLPPSLAETISPILGTLAGTVTLASEFSYLEAMINRADSEVPADQDSVINLLAGSGSYTAFAPPNAVFENLAGSEDPAVVQDFINSYDPATARNVLLTHISEDGALAASDFTDGATITTVSGVTLTVTVEESSANSPTGIFISSPGSADIPVLEADVLHTNGVAHVIGGLLLP